LGHGAIWVPLFGIVGAALFYGDALITPAVSVLSAIEGLNEYNKAFDPYVVPLTALILVVLFSVQARGTASVATFFGPVMCLWFVAIAVPGLYYIAANPGILLAFNPAYGLSFLLAHGVVGLATLGAVFLAVTGAEALYADLGHFGKRPIQLAWLGLVLPALATEVSSRIRSFCCIRTGRCCRWCCWRRPPPSSRAKRSSPAPIR
jgi:KUP system potassium uptake protein